MPGASEPTLFDDVREKNVIFLIDTSGSMYCRLAVVKQHLKEFLLKMAFKGCCKFNIIEFNSTVTQWADQMVECLPETVRVASDWVSSLEAKTGTNTESALLAAYNDDECDAVYLVTDGLPDSKPSDILDRVAYVCNSRACHCIYLTGASVDKSATNFLQDLATDTFGSFMIVTVTNHGSIDRVTPVYKASHSGTGVIRTTNRQVYSGNQKQCSVTSTLDNPPPMTAVVRGVPAVRSPYELPVAPPGVLIPPVSAVQGSHPGVVYPNPYCFVPGPRVYTEDNGRVLRVPYFNYAWAQWYQPYLWARYRTARSWLKLSDDLDGAVSSIGMSPAAGALLIDQPVLARRTEDGLYYSGRVKSQISNDRFLVEFSPCERGGFNETSYQETFVFDIVQVNDARRHSIMKGDKVLAPLEDNPAVYAPATAIEGQEGRESSPDLEERELIVMYSMGRSSTVMPGKAIWIDQLLYERTAFELKLPKKTRRQIVDTVAGYPEESYPGYPVSGSERDPVEWELPRKYHVTGNDETFQPHTGLAISKQSYEDYRPFLKDHSQKSAVRKADVERTIPGTNISEEELQRKVDSQIRANHRELGEHERSVMRKMELDRQRQLVSTRQQQTSSTKDEIDRDISMLEAELKYKMKLRDQALEQKKKDIDSEIDLKIRERDELMRERRLLLEQPSETRLSRERRRMRSVSPHDRSRSPSMDRGRGRSRDDYHYRSRSRSLSTERAPSFGHLSPRYHSRSRSLSPSRSRSQSRSVNFDESLNSHHSYRYDTEDYYSSMYDSGFGEEKLVRDSGTNTPIIRNGREIKMKKSKDERPPWKYWKSEAVPDVVGPPLHEPYNQSAVAEPLELRDVHVRNGVLEWGSSHFNNVVPNGVTNYDRFLRTPNTSKSVSFQDSHTHIAPGSNLVTYASPEEKKLKLRQNTSQQRLTTMTPATYYMNGDSVGTTMQDFHRERVNAQMTRERSRPATSYMRQVSNQKPKTCLKDTSSSANSSYQKEVSATSYKRELDHRSQVVNTRTPQQRRVAAMSARREERDLLQAAKLQQQQNNQTRNLTMKRERAASRDDTATINIMRDIAKERSRPLSQMATVM